MTLVEWRKVNNKTQRWVSAATGIEQALISKYENGTTKPLPPNAQKIERVTEGAVTIRDWYPLDETL